MPETIVLPQIVAHQVPHYVSPDSANRQIMIPKVHTIRSKGQMVDTLRVLGRYDLHTSTHVHPKLTQRDYDAVRRNELYTVPHIPCKHHANLMWNDSSLEVEMGSHSLPPTPEVATWRTPSRADNGVLAELKAKQRKTCMFPSSQNISYCFVVTL